MALDGAFLHTVKFQIESEALESRIDKIYQPSREEIVFVMRSKGWVGKLLLSAGADSPRIHFTNSEIENPKAPPMFCMLLRKHLSGGKLKSVRQLGLDRVLYLDFETRNEFGDDVMITVAVEIMGRHSNIIIVGPDQKILDSIKRIDLEMSG
ncbi:MAG: NFACT family protein, partial [Oscillospiraceae bacterium]